MRTFFQRQRLRRNTRITHVQHPRPHVINLEAVSQLTQICLAVVAIFGYFYTVRPIYQKDQLAEQVAEFDVIIRKQAPKVAAFEAELQELRTERTKLNEEIQAMQGKLRGTRQEMDIARLERNKLEAQTQFMAYRYRLPDGSPATTQEQVIIAQANDLRRSFHSSVKVSCGIFSRNKDVRDVSYDDFDEKNKYWPFSELEYRILKEHGVRYPRLAAMDCINAVANEYRGKPGVNLKDIDQLRGSLLDQVEQRAIRPWAFVALPDEIISSLRKQKDDVEEVRQAELKKANQEYGDWANITSPDRREIYKSNFNVGLINAKSKAISGRMSAEHGARENANKLRKSIQEEISRLVSDDGRKKEP